MLGVQLRAGVFYGAVKDIFLPISSSPWALLVSQLLLSLSLSFKELLLSSEHSPGALASWLEAAHLYCALLLVAARAQ